MNRSIIILLLIFISAAGDAAEAFKIGGWTETVVIVDDIKPHSNFLRKIGSWEVVHTSRLSKTMLRFLDLPESTRAKQMLMRNKGSQSGYIRFLQFSGVEQQHIRPDAQSWDTGGIFDINMRITDMDSKYKEIQNAGWYGTSMPSHFNFGKFEVKEWIARGRDGLTIAFIERIKPELEGWPNLVDFSRSFNSTQIVKNVSESRKFYEEVLGFKQYMYHNDSSKSEGPNVLGLPHNLTDDVAREVVILNPDGNNEGSVELLQFHGAVGSDYSARAVAPNLGIYTLRFPVDGIDAFAKHLSKNNVEITARADNVLIQPYGKVRLLSLKTPDGTPLVFYEPYAE